MNAVLGGDDGAECPRCDARDWRDDGTLTCEVCGHTPRPSVRDAIREVLDR